MSKVSTERLDFWNKRSELGFTAGSGDFNLKRLEAQALEKHICNSKHVLDAGCGNAHSLTYLATKFNKCKFYGFDYSEGMIKAGNNLIEKKALVDQINLCSGDLLNPPNCELLEMGAPSDGFDIVYSERSLINLDTQSEQQNAIEKLWELVATGGKLILCEAFIEGLNEINFFRASASLPKISPPWHNRYMSLNELDIIEEKLNAKPKIIEFSGTYYFVSRVIHAQASLIEGTTPSYDSPINLQSLEIHPLGVCGQSKLVIFEKS